MLTLHSCSLVLGFLNNNCNRNDTRMIEQHPLLESDLKPIQLNRGVSLMAMCFGSRLYSIVPISKIRNVTF